MSGIQLLLITGVAFISLYFFIQLKKRLLDILLLAFLIVCAIALILKPDVTTIIAHKIGVGRGADLVFYISILIFWFVVLKLYARIRKLEKDLTKLVRNDALNTATQQSFTDKEDANGK